MLNKGAQEFRVRGDLGRGLLGAREQFFEFGGREISHRVGLGVAPDKLHRVELRCIGRQQVGAHAPLGGEPVGHRTPVVGTQAIPNELDRPVHGARESAQEIGNRLAIVIGVWQETEIGTHPSSCGRDRQGGDHRDLASGAASLSQYRGLSARCPTAAYERGHQETRFVDEDDERLPARGVFFTRGHSSLIQRVMASSSRSNARRVGFCGLHPSAWSNRPT